MCVLSLRLWRVTMRIVQIIVGLILLGGAAWAVVRTYKGRGKSSWLVLMFALFLTTLGLYFVVRASAALLRDFRVGSEWIK
jgi:hypothetical protein